MPRAVVAVANGAEEMEVVIVVDVLRRASWDVAVVGLDAGPVTASRGVRLVPDCAWDAVDVLSYDVMVLPGGMGGTDSLMADPRVLEAIRAFSERDDKWVAAICAAPRVLQAAGVLSGRTVTSHPSVREELTVPTLSDDRVVVDGTLITSQGPGTAFEFALALIRALDGDAAASRIAAGLVL